MSLDHILLGLLRQPASGYELKRMFDESIGHFWAAELSQIYPTLKRLERHGWLRARRADSQRGAGKRVYQTTPAGHAALREWLQAGPRVGDERFEFLAQVYFMDELEDPARTADFLAQLRAGTAQKLAALRMIEQRWAREDPRYPDQLPAFDFHVNLTLRLGVMTLAAKLKWCDESIRRLRHRQPSPPPRRRQSSARRSARSDSRAASH
jgi:PadR family transcriptional regulator, phenolic acid-responsive transcriptional regulator